MDRNPDVVIVGAGPAGLAVAATLSRVGFKTLIIEAQSELAANWRTRYDNLTLNTMRSFSALPGLKIPKKYGRYPSRDNFIAYLEQYARFHSLNIEYEFPVERIERDEKKKHWEISSNKNSVQSKYLVVATGYDASPFLPSWAVDNNFVGNLIHASKFKNANAYKDREVLVVGAGNSGVDIAGLLAKAGANVTLSMRTSPNIFPRDWGFLPLQPAAILAGIFPPPIGDAVGRLIQYFVFGNLSVYGIPPSPEGIQSTYKHRLIGPAVDDGFIAALKTGRARVCAAVESLDFDEATLIDGSKIRPHVIICATGYSRGLEGLVSQLGVLGTNGAPSVLPGQEKFDHTGIYFIGFRGSPSGQIRLMPQDAKFIARSIMAEEGKN